MELKKIKLPFKVKNEVLALGSQTKNRVCFIKNNVAILSSVHPDLNRPRDFLGFEKSVGYFLKKAPRIISYDLHPEYQSSKYVLSLPVTYNRLPIQHHHCHIASCMLENGMRNQKVIGVAFDGTGLGIDNTLWGAEFLVCDYKDFQRKAHLREIPLLGAEKAILEPWRIAAAWLYLIFKDRFLNLDINFVKKIDKKKWRVLKNMYLSKFNSPQASSMGRLFDAVGSLVLENNKVRFEAELAIELEKIASGCPSTMLGAGRHEIGGYKFKIIKEKNNHILDPRPVFSEIILDLKRKEPKRKIAYKFHLTVAEMIKKMCLLLRKKTRINKIVLSGGVFQNKLLLRLSLDLLYKQGFKVFIHKGLSCNDSSIALGQAIVANFRS